MIAKIPKLVPPKVLRTADILFIDKNKVVMMYQELQNKNRIAIYNATSQTEGGAITIREIRKNTVVLNIELLHGTGEFVMDNESSLDLTNTEGEIIINVSLHAIKEHFEHHPLNN